MPGPGSRFSEKQDRQASHIAASERARGQSHDDLAVEIAKLLAAARREGAAEMRERAAQLAWGYCTDRTDDVARGIRALPLKPEAPT